MTTRYLLALLALVASATSAQTIKPGLWEIQNQMQGANGSKMNQAMAEMQKQLASMPPEQRKMIEDAMAKQGAQVSPGQGGGMAVKICMTQEMVDRNDMGAQPGDCTQTTSARSGNTQKFAFSCTKPPSRGEGTVTFVSPEAYTVKIKTTATVKGREESMDMQASGKWLGTDCGTVKPPSVKR
ncbi:MAG: DUF3617 domain-containing protein [Rhodoferax sp.]|nr:DUF3617 domain-containing protein [Rhodoferax sp.]